MEGWIKLHRKLKENPIYDKPVGLKIWLECLFSATHSDFPIDYGGKEKILKPGEFVFGRHEWGKRLKMNHMTVYKWIKKLNERGMIRVQVTEQGLPTIYKIEKWSEYQQEVQVRVQPSKQVSKQPRYTLVSTNNNDKNNKNIRSIVPAKKYSSLKDISEADISQIATEYKVSVGFVKLQLEKVRNYCSSKGKVYKNYKSALRNFVLGDMQRNIERSAYDNKRGIDATNL